MGKTAGVEWDLTQERALSQVQVATSDALTLGLCHPADSVIPKVYMTDKRAVRKPCKTEKMNHCLGV